MGNCAIMRHKLPADVNIGIDIDPNVINAWENLKGSPLAPANSIYNRSVHLDLFHADFFEYAEKCLPAWNFPDCFVYLDPPYLMETRKKETALYKNELTRADHVRLLRVAMALKSQVMISCYDNELYSSYLAKWNKHTFIGKTRSGGVEETIYMNYKLEGKLHDYRYTGSNFTDRQRIKRKVARHVEKLRNLPDAERNAILEALATSFS